MDELWSVCFKQAKFITFPCAACVTRKPLPKQILDATFSPRLDLTADEDAYCTGYHLNDHHIKPRYIWDNYISTICDFLSIPFNADDFVSCPYCDESGMFDLSYHDPKDKEATSYSYLDINMYETKGTFDILRLIALERSGVYRNPISRYHNLFYGYHSNARIFNHTPKTPIKALIVCDSMMIPIIPILAYYCQELTVVDNRERKPWLTNFSNHNYDLVVMSRILCDFTMEDLRFRFY